MELAVGTLIGPTYHRRGASPRRARRVVAAALALLAPACALAALGLRATPAEAASTAAPASSQTLIVEGAGDGHGVGMSQYGALELAEHGYSDAQILAHYYRGTAIGAAPAGHVVRVLVGSKVLELPLETYVKGVVAAEMPSGWPAAALEAQAIASRTYALTSDAGGTRFDVYSDTRSQVYRGAAAETPASNAAVEATAGQIVTYGGQPAITYFFASSGGMTENVENAFFGAAPRPWLQGVSDPYETSASSWHLSLSMEVAAERLAGLVHGRLLGIEVLTRGVSPRILSAEVLGSAGSTQVNGAELESRLGLPSTWAYFSIAEGTSVTREPDLSGQHSHSAPPKPAAAHKHAKKSAKRGRPRAPAPVADRERGGVAAPVGQAQQAASAVGGVAAP